MREGLKKPSIDVRVFVADNFNVVFTTLTTACQPRISVLLLLAKPAVMLFNAVEVVVALFSAFEKLKRTQWLHFRCCL